MTKQPLIVYGCSDPFVFDIIETATLLGHEVIAIDNTGGAAKDLPCEVLPESAVQSHHRAIPVITGDAVYAEFAPLRRDRALIETLKRLRADAAAAGFSRWSRLVHPSAVVFSTATIGVNVFINANSTVSSNTRIGDHSRINRNAAIGHDIQIGDDCQINPGAVLISRVTLCDDVFVAAGCSVLNGVTLGVGSTAGAGSLVTRDVPAGELVMGTPARVVTEASKEA